MAHYNVVSVVGCIPGIQDRVLARATWAAASALRSRRAGRCMASCWSCNARNPATIKTISKGQALFQNVLISESGVGRAAIAFHACNLI